MFAEPSGRGRNDSPRQTAGMVGNSAKGDDEMTDDKGAGEGPYFLSDSPEKFCGMKWKILSGPTAINPDYLDELVEWDLEHLRDELNAAYAEGRKSMEKEFKELLDLANGMFDRIIEGRSCAKAVKDFDAWKKARGIE